MISYPGSLPCPQYKKSVVNLPDDLLRSDTDYAHNEEYVQRGTVGLPFTITCTQDQAETFKTFYDSLYGVQPFNADWLILGDTSTKVIRYTSEYRIKSLGAGLYEISADCEVL